MWTSPRTGFIRRRRNLVTNYYHIWKLSSFYGPYDIARSKRLHIFNLYILALLTTKSLAASILVRVSPMCSVFTYVAMQLI
jgi:hypothetical protein